MRAFVHCRVSTQEQATDDHCSLANQEAHCRDYIKHRSWHLVKVLKDVGSGKSAERAKLPGTAAGHPREAGGYGGGLPP